jgi:hypothetical protein
MSTQLFANNAISLLNSQVAITDTSLTVLAGTGDLFPNPGPNEYFLVTLEDQAATRREIIKVTARFGDTFTTIERAQEGTTAQFWSASSPNETLVDLRITAATMRLAMLLPEQTASSGSRIFNANVSVVVNNTTTDIFTDSAYQSGSTALFVGGMRQKLNIDYIESGPTKLTLTFVLTQELIDEGQHITLDYTLA